MSWHHYNQSTIVVIAFYAQSPQRLHANGLIDAAYLILAACAAGPEAV